MKAKVFKTVESVPEITDLTVFWQIFVNLEDVSDWVDIAANNGSTRRIVYCYGDLSGMEKLQPVTSKGLNLVLKNRLLTIFTIFREH